jgi:predicted phosphodiesterase
MDRVAIVSDVHGNLPALEAVAADIPSRGVSRVVNLGDHVSGPLWPRETAAFLMARPWVAIAGNHDRQVSRDDPATHGPSDRFAWSALDPNQRAWLAALPATLVLDALGLLLCHGTPTSDTDYLIETIEHGRLRLAAPDELTTRLGAVATRVVACGHSHVPRLVRTTDGVTCLNPGSVGLPAYADDGERPHVSETGSPLARYAVVERRGDEATVTFVAVAYDWESAARRALVNGRPDWAAALRTGHAPR